MRPSCSTCATILPASKPSSSSSSASSPPSLPSSPSSPSSFPSPLAEKPMPPGHDPDPDSDPESNLNPNSDPETTQPCCSRLICGPCVRRNPRFGSYCPYCQLSTDHDLALAHLTPRPVEPPAYVVAVPRYPVGGQPPPRPTFHSPHNEDNEDNDDNGDDDNEDDVPPPPYEEIPPSHSSSSSSSTPSSSPYKPKSSSPHSPQDTLHFLHPTDTIPSLSLLYNIPPTALRLANNLPTDALLSARRTVLIPATHYRAGVSLSPRPVEGEDEERRRGQVRRFMTTTKVADWDVASVYLEDAGWVLEEALAAFFEDDAWEGAHPLGGRNRGGGEGSSWRRWLFRRGTR